jgi:hypothetical protein
MAARRLVAGVFLALVPALACAQATGAGSSTPGSSSQSSPATQSDSQSQADGTSSSVHHKAKANSGQTVHHTKVAEEEPPPPALTKAEELIRKQDYAAAEPLLRKVLAGDAANDPANYVAWFELGFVENGLGKTDESVDAYRKSERRSRMFLNRT